MRGRFAPAGRQWAAVGEFLPFGKLEKVPIYPKIQSFGAAQHFGEGARLWVFGVLHGKMKDGDAVQAVVAGAFFPNKQAIVGEMKNAFGALGAQFIAKILERRHGAWRGQSGLTSSQMQAKAAAKAACQ